MIATGNLRRRCLKTLASVLQSNNPLNKDVAIVENVSSKVVSINLMQSGVSCEDCKSSVASLLRPINGQFRSMSMARGRTMRSKVEARMRKESGKTLKEIRRAKKMKLKLMDDNERLVYNLKRAKKKVALLLQKLKKYDLPELPTSLHDPELFTPEQVQAFKKIGYKNKNYVPVGVRGVFGGVVQNMHMHWKFHETVQVCCDNFPKEKIKEMATMIARLSGGIVINIHNTKTIIMFRGRNYRQPKNLIPFNTLTKRKALFKARFEQALESQKLNIKKTEQELRKKGISPEDPVAMASIQRVASTFFNAIDKKEGSPYVFQSDKLSLLGHNSNMEESEPGIDSDQEELDQFIAEIEDAADKEWAEEEEAEKEELGQIRYLNREDHGGRFRRSRNDDDSENETRGPRGLRDGRDRRKASDYDDDDYDSDNVSDVSDPKIDANYSRNARGGFEQRRRESQKPRNIGRVHDNKGFDRSTKSNVRGKKDEVSKSRNTLSSDVRNAMWESDDESEDDLEKSRYKGKQDKTGRPRVEIDSESEDESEDDLEKSRYKGKQDKTGRPRVEIDSESEDESEDDLEKSRYKGKQDKTGKPRVEIDSESEDESEDDLEKSRYMGKQDKTGRPHVEIDSESEDDVYNKGENQISETDDNEDSQARGGIYWESSEEECPQQQQSKIDSSSVANPRREKTRQELDETWDSD